MEEGPKQSIVRRKKGFLDLPPELRLTIYDELLIGRLSWNLDPIERQGWIYRLYYPKTGFIHDNLWKKANPERADLQIQGARREIHPSTMCFSKSERYYADSLGPYPAILFTCRTIAEEAIPILYQKNRFTFKLQPPLNPDALKPTAVSIRKLSKKLFKYPFHNWNPNPAFRSSEFLAFLNAIGRRNATSICSIAFEGYNADHVADWMPTMTEVVRHHLSGLRDFKVLIKLKYIDQGDRPLPYHRSLPIWANGRFWPLYTALERFIGTVGWLENFHYEGHPHYSEFKCGWEGLKRLQELENLVKGSRRLGELQNISTEEQDIAAYGHKTGS